MTFLLSSVWPGSLLVVPYNFFFRGLDIMHTLTLTFMPGTLRMESIN
jgi:hypothetical protein